MIEAALCLVVAICDGDTLKVRCQDGGAFRLVTVRLAEIDAPEKGQPYGQVSKRALAALCAGQWAQVSAQKSDRYGRTVARVTCRGQDASLHQVKQGLAWAYTQYLTDPAVGQAQVDARAAHDGLWHDAEPTSPWQWRKDHGIGARTKAS